MSPSFFRRPHILKATSQTSTSPRPGASSGSRTVVESVGDSDDERDDEEEDAPALGAVASPSPLFSLEVPPSPTPTLVSLNGLPWWGYAAGVVVVGCVLYTGWSLFFRSSSAS